MKAPLALILGGVLVVTSLVAIPAQADLLDDLFRRGELNTTRRISLIQSIRNAERETGGSAIAAELDSYRNDLAYRVVVTDVRTSTAGSIFRDRDRRDSEFRTVYVAASDGDILHVLDDASGYRGLINRSDNRGRGNDNRGRNKKNRD